MKRRAAPIGIRIMRVLAWVAVGAVINVAVAWVAASPLNCTSKSWSRASDSVRPALAPREWAFVHCSGRDSRVAFVEECYWRTEIPVVFGTTSGESWRVPNLLPAEEQYRFLTIVRSGWPWLGACRWVLTDTILKEEHHAALDLNWVATGKIYLPLLPIWPGFALNTLFYAALAWGLWQLPLALRRRSRSKKGLCVRCGYDLKGLGGSAAERVCPECGTTAGE